MFPLTAVLGDHVSTTEELVSWLAASSVGAGGGVCVVTTLRAGEGALR